MAVQEKFYSADDLWELSHRDDDDEDKRYELDEGELLVMSPTGDIHGVVAAWFSFLIMSHVIEFDLGEVTAAETGFVLSKHPVTGRETVRAPDVEFIAKARLLPKTGKYYRLAPDLVVEVVSPSDTARQIRRKARQFLRAGTRLVWVVYPDDGDRFVDVFQPDLPMETFKGQDILVGGDVLPGFSVTVDQIFSRLNS